jgi:acetyltransferase-like isoleucine patch superfamily enzyme
MSNTLLNKLKKKLGRKSYNGFTLNKSPDSSFTNGNGAEITNTNIFLTGKSELIIGDNVKLDGYDIHINNGYLKIDQFSQLIKGRQALNPIISINNGTLIIGAYNIIKADLKINFGGICSIGTYNSINEQTEIRCDESVTIGDYNMISYECMIFDTNTHCIYPSEIRRERTRADFPYIGTETEKPDTRAVIIGNDTWLGKRCVILKGCTLGNGVIMGTNAVVSNRRIDSGVLVGNPAYVIGEK